MGSYLNFRDLGSVFTAGSQLQAAGATAETSVTTAGSELVCREGVFCKTDSYSEPFWSETYAAKDRNTEIYKASKYWAGVAKEMGADVVKAATRIVWQDALAGAELASAMEA